MALKHNFYFFSAMLYLLISSCSQDPSSQKNSNPTSAIKQEKAALVIPQQSELDTLKGSLQAEAQGKIGQANVKISYHSPAVRGRVVWGGLVPYDQVWVTGAHSATSLETDRELTIGAKKIPPGKYALFTIPGKTEWTMIINKNWQQHLADNYSDKDDLARIDIEPENMQERQERLRYQILAYPENKGEIVVSWDKLKVSLPITTGN